MINACFKLHGLDTKHKHENRLLDILKVKEPTAIDLSHSKELLMVNSFRRFQPQSSSQTSIKFIQEASTLLKFPYWVKILIFWNDTMSSNK